jgi:hypothetical protein
MNGDTAAVHNVAVPQERKRSELEKGISLGYMALLLV